MSDLLVDCHRLRKTKYKKDFFVLRRTVASLRRLGRLPDVGTQRLIRDASSRGQKALTLRAMGAPTDSAPC